MSQENESGTYSQGVRHFVILNSYPKKTIESCK